ncbi:type II toxin-antitoxin system VapC family toxin [Aetokthonos hydrillicola Thurmond2011]|jgi:tRNA(fMet)-specific endonuclease VapC|uniref:Type II toxin-antitoxin system VapC family toxin n=1 Tax=Aetokthonos hydrillicola Thurmond2011 TaxID=2712845 RepID=A0AAP5MDE2_9CYAN|nr:PIN domain-containing protein [Aetokthonos hydrillicola]MDR9900452.1 type II toxin-antitoxin system VapC family toxin [Aetokthonos hydrillicola Thurmond2011]
MIYILDTDHLSLYGRNHPILIPKLLAAKIQLTTTAINVEEQLRGRLAQVAEAREGFVQSNAYQRLVETVMLLSEFNVLTYDEKSQEIYQNFRAQRIRIGTQDLRIASIVIANKGILLTRNLRDFEKVPGLTIQDWST